MGLSVPPVIWLSVHDFTTKEEHAKTITLCIYDILPYGLYHVFWISVFVLSFSFHAQKKRLIQDTGSAPRRHSAKRVKPAVCIRCKLLKMTLTRILIRLFNLSFAQTFAISHGTPIQRIIFNPTCPRTTPISGCHISHHMAICQPPL